MPILGVPVSLGEVLENSAPLKEADIWGVLCQGAEAIQDLFFRGEAIQDGVANFVISLDTLLLSPNGRAQFNGSSQTKNISNFIAPEIHTGILMSEAAIEKIYVYSLGKTLQVAIDYSLQKDPTLTISRNLESLLNAMCEKNPSLRIALIHVLEACSLQSQRRTVTRTPSFSQTVARLAKTVTGTQADLSYWSYDHFNSYNCMNNNNSGSGSDQSRQSTLNRRSLRNRRSSRRNRRRNGSGRNQKEKDRSRSRSPARSSSRSRSRSHSNAGNIENTDPKDDKSCDNSSTSSQGLVKTSRTTASPKRRPSFNSRPSSLYIPASTPNALGSTSQNCSNASQYSFSSGSSSRHRRSPSSLFGAKADVATHLANTPAYEKYLRLKDRQRKLQALHKNQNDDTGFWGSDNSDGFSDTRSVTSGISIMQDEAGPFLLSPNDSKSAKHKDQWSFMPDLSSAYGQDMALKLGPRGSDRDSIVSSEMSFFQNDSNGMRSEIDPTPLYAAPSLKSMTEQALRLHSNTHSSSYGSVPRSPSSSILSSLGDECGTVNKEYNGPEFICRGRKPLVKLNMPLSGDSAKNPSHARRVIIVLLNGQKLEAMCDPSTTGKQLFQTVVSHLDLQEIQSYFGLTFIHDGEHFFLDADTKLHKVAPDGWREGNKGQAAITFIVFFRIKFYGTSITDTKHQHLLYLQLRQDILEERIECDENRALSLAAFALQVECGNYQKEMMGRNYFVPEYYFSKRILQLYGTGFIRDHTPDAHRTICGLSHHDAVSKFIRLVQELPEYGTHFHKVYKTKNENPNSVSWVGIGAHSMIIAENLKKERVIIERHPWAMVDKLSFKGKRITIQVKQETNVGGKPFKLYFYTNSHRKGRYLLQMSTDQHKFQRRMCEQSNIMSSLQTNKTLPEPPMFADIEFADLEEEDEDDEMYQLSSPITQLPNEIPHPLSSTLHDSLNSVWPSTKPNHHLLSPEYPSYPRSSRPLSACLHVPNDKFHSNQLTGSSRSLLSLPFLPVKYSHDDHHPQFRISLSPIPPLNTSNSKIIGSTNHMINSTSHILDFSGCDVKTSGATVISLKEVVLKKDNSSSIGISFVAGTVPPSSTSTATSQNGTTNQSRYNKPGATPGIFIESIVPGGLADINGHIKPDDQLLAINSSTVTGLSCQDIINKIEQSKGRPIQLLLLDRSQNPTDNAQVPASNEPDANQSSETSLINSTVPMDQDWSMSANDFVSRALTSSRRHSSGSALIYLNNHYIPEHHVSVPNNLDGLQETVLESPITSNKFFHPTILSGSLLSLQEPQKYKNHLKKQRDPQNPSQREKYFHSINSDSIPEFPQIQVTTAPISSMPILVPQDSLSCPPDYLATPLAISTPASSPMLGRNSRSEQQRLSLTSAKRLLAKQNKQVIFREKTGSIRKQRQDEKFYECFLIKQDGTFGLNIIGGLDTKSELGGVYVKSIRPDGPADRNATIKKDDRIVQINSISLEDVQHDEAVKILQESPKKCLLVLGRKQSSLDSKIIPNPNGIASMTEKNPGKSSKKSPKSTNDKNQEKRNFEFGKTSDLESSSILEKNSPQENKNLEVNGNMAPKRTNPNDDIGAHAATLRKFPKESHGGQQGIETTFADTRIQNGTDGKNVPNKVEKTLHDGVSPTSEGPQMKKANSVGFTSQRNGHTKNEGNPKPGPHKDLTFSDKKNKSAFNKVTAKASKNSKHFGNGNGLQKEPSNSANLDKEPRGSPKNTDDSPPKQKTVPGFRRSTCLPGGTPTEDSIPTKTRRPKKNTLTPSKQKPNGEAVLPKRNLLEYQSENLCKGDPTSQGGSTQEELTPNLTKANQNSVDTMQKKKDEPEIKSNPTSLSGSKLKKDNFYPMTKEFTRPEPGKLPPEPMRVDEKRQDPKERGNKFQDSQSEITFEDKRKIFECPDSTGMKKVLPSTCLKSGPTSDIQDAADKVQLENLNWLWEVPLVRSPDVINRNFLLQLVEQLENSLQTEKYLQEFQMIKKKSISSRSKTKVALLPENKSKNRFQEFVPYDDSRVLLLGPQNYINASHIKLDVRQSTWHFIACQSPMLNTVVDFWQMIWETKTPTIVMLGHEVELGRRKCFRYWPDIKDKPLNVEEKFQIELIERHSLPGFDARFLQVSCQSSGNQHQVMQFMFKVWPFRGTPSSPVSLLQLTQAVYIFHNASEKQCHPHSSAGKCPMVVHCVNGCGRSAIFIAVFTALLNIQKNIQFDIFSLVKNLRLQRQEMIETKADYKFCYTAILRALDEILRPLEETMVPHEAKYITRMGIIVK